MTVSPDADLARRARGGRRQLIARAVGLHRHSALHICDATAGLGRDGLLFAALGARVDLVERNADIFRELTDTVARLPEEWRQRVQLHHADAREVLPQSEWDVVYLDPMFTPDGKTALPKAPAQRLRLLVESQDADAGELLPLARRHARRRVVVKRARRAPPLAGVEPHQAMPGHRVRFDLYRPAVEIGND